MKKETSPHDGKHFVIQKGKAECNQGNQYPQFKVTSQQRHYFNDPANNTDYLAVTEDDLQFNPPGASFGQCKLKPSSGGNLPCTFAAVGKWLKTYDKTKVDGKRCVSEISELLCSTGGKITVKDHGQRSVINKKNIINADPKTYAMINPFMDLRELQEELEDSDNDYE